MVSDSESIEKSPMLCLQKFMNDEFRLSCIYNHHLLIIYQCDIKVVCSNKICFVITWLIKYMKAYVNLALLTSETINDIEIQWRIGYNKLLCGNIKPCDISHTFQLIH